MSGGSACHEEESKEAIECGDVGVAVILYGVIRKGLEQRELKQLKE